MPINDDPFASLPNAAGDSEQDPFASLPNAGEAPQQEQQGWSSMLPATGDNSPFMQAVAAEKGTAVKSFMDKVTIFNHGFETHALGALQMLQPVGFSQQDFTNRKKQIDAEYEQAYKDTPSPVMNMAGTVGGDTVASVPGVIAAMTLGPAKWIGNFLMAGMGSASSGIVDYADSSQERLQKGVTSGLLGAGTYAAGSAISKALASIILPKIGASSFATKLFNPQKAAAEDFASSLKLDAGNDAAKAAASVQAAASKAAAGMTPGEAIGGPSVRALESGIVVDEAAKGAAAASIIQRSNAAKKEIYESIGAMATPKVRAAKDAAFKNMEQEFILPDGQLMKGAPPASTNYIPDFIKNNKVLSDKYDEIANAQVSNISKLPDNSVAKLHKIEESLKNELNAAMPDKTGATANPLKDIKMKEIEEARSIIRSILDQSDEFQKAMAASAKIETNKHLKTLLRTKKTSAGAKGKLSIDQIYDAIIPQKMLQKDFMDSVVKAGGDPKLVKGIVDIAESLRKAPLLQVLKNQPGATPTLTASGQALSGVQKMVADMTLDRYNKALLDLTLSGSKWVDDITKVLQMPKGEVQQTGFLDLIKRAVVITPAVGVSRAMTGE